MNNILAKRMNTGVDIRLLTDPSFASHYFSKILDLLELRPPDRYCKLK
ncbi:hypothetical protein MITS9509_03080 [Synechococcus sp. MIT S9509]|nr:hypothetical protein MITS9504_03018 [Synechococcus sp. MIT S9504]KZR89236.1 hypothetical protein MITS9509_03080 [Synechococcus sp. MIT S9509]